MMCSKPTCSRKAQAGGFCRPHYKFEMRGKPTGMVSSGPVSEHIRALQAAGISQNRLASLVDMPHITIWRIANGKHDRVLASSAAKILGVPASPSVWRSGHERAYVSAAGSRRRLRALCATGHTTHALAGEMGVTQKAVSNLSSGAQEFVTVGLAKSVSDLFDRLQLSPGRSAIARKRALAKGWHPPLAWDEETIDDPGAVPQLPESGRYDWVGDYEYLREIGLDDEAIAERFGLKRGSLQSRLYRAGRGAYSHGGQRKGSVRK